MTREYLRYIFAPKTQCNLTTSHHSNQRLIHRKNLELILFLPILAFEGIWFHILFSLTFFATFFISLAKRIPIISDNEGEMRKISSWLISK